MPKLSLDVPKDVLSRVEVVKRRLQKPGATYSTEGMLRDLVVLGLDALAQKGGDPSVHFARLNARERSTE
jgi:hypothetical protein